MSDPLNPHYDEPGVFYDAGFFYADGVPDIPTKPTTRKPMASISANLSRSNPTQLIALADLVSPKLAPAAPATPPVPNMTTKVANLVTARNATKSASAAYESAKTTLVSLKAARDAAADTLREEHKAVISAVESEAKGDATMLSASGYGLAATSAQLSTVPGQIFNVVLTAGDADGTLDLSFDPEANSKTYEVQVTGTDPVAGPWTTKAQPTTSSLLLSGLTSASRVWVRVRGVGSKGAGAWSDPATKIVP